MIHIHGIGARDHQSLALQPRSKVARVFNFLSNAEFGGVVTLEVFGLEDFVSSKRVVEEWANGSR